MKLLVLRILGTLYILAFPVTIIFGAVTGSLAPLLFLAMATLFVMCAVALVILIMLIWEL